MTSKHAELTVRQMRILCVLVENHIRTKDPVSSQSIATTLKGSWSSATVRSELAVLTRMGHLTQPHTSAGRVPTATAIRLYVDATQHRHKSPANPIMQSMRIPSAGTTMEWVRQISSTLSHETQLPGVAIQPSGPSKELKKLEFVYLEPGKLLAILITTTGEVFHHRFEWKKAFSRRELEHFNNFIQDKMNGRSLIELRQVIRAELELDRVRANALLHSALELCSTVLDSSQGTSLLFHGKDSLLMMAEFDSLEDVRAIVSGMSRKDLWLGLLDRTIKTPGVQLLIGNESCIDGLENCSIIVAPYGTATTGRGAVGVFGPINMHYSKMIPLVHCAASLLNHQIEAAEG
jgi:heat-inducible transcriptional repressor